MDVQELKFLLKLLGCNDYRGSLADVKPNPKTTGPQLRNLCRQLGDRELIACTEEITKLAISPAGKSLLASDISQFPVTATELKVLHMSANKSITPGQLKTIPAAQRQALIRDLIARGFLKIEDKKIKEVWLTERGKTYLRDECSPSGNNPAFSGKQLNHYLKFIRKFVSIPSAEPERFTVPNSNPSDRLNEKLSDTNILTDILADILQSIQELDRQIGSKNYLPIFYLRDRWQSTLSREELDTALYQLQRSDRISLSALQEGSGYTLEQLEAGIPREFGGALFFIIVN
jgi:hypothetical protein